MKAVILAAGYATRLYPLTENKPKALLPLGGGTILGHIIKQVDTIDDVDEVIIVSNHKFSGCFYDWMAGVECAKPLTVLDDGSTSEQDRLGAIGDIQFAVEEAGIDDDVMIIAGDNLFTFSLPDYYAFFKRVGADCVAVKDIEDRALLCRFAVAVLDERGRVAELVEKPEEPRSNTAVYATYIYKKETVPLFRSYLAEGNKPDAPGYFVQWLYKRRPVYAWKMNGECYDVGTLESYEEVRRLFE